MDLFVKTVRSGLEVSQESFARMVGVSVRTVSRWETGFAQPKGLALAKLAGVIRHQNGVSKILPPQVLKEYKRVRRVANYTLGNTVQRGEIPRVCTLYSDQYDTNIRCVDCGEKAQQYDHRDYFKPLQVDAVCQSCNVRRGLAIATFSDHQDHWKRFQWS